MHVINNGNELPVKAKNVRVSPQAEHEINTQVSQMLANGIIRPSMSPWANRVILVRRKDQTLRFAVDYRGLNDVTKKDSSPPRDQRYTRQIKRMRVLFNSRRSQCLLEHSNRRRGSREDGFYNSKGTI